MPLHSIAKTLAECSLAVLLAGCATAPMDMESVDAGALITYLSGGMAPTMQTILIEEGRVCLQKSFSKPACKRVKPQEVSQFLALVDCETLVHLPQDRASGFHDARIQIEACGSLVLDFDPSAVPPDIETIIQTANRIVSVHLPRTYYEPIEVHAAASKH